jgi:phosphatidylglycerol:prolipoprotein diacylglycerol transferase
MHPILFHVPAFPAWVGAAVLAAVAAIFAFLAKRDREDRGSLLMAVAFGVGAVVLVVKMGATTPVGPLPIRLFGILVVCGFLAANRIAASRNERLGLLDRDQTFDLTFYVLLVGLLGSRMLHVFQHSEDFNGRPGKILAIWDGGLVWYGGAVSSALYAWYWLAKRGRDVWRVSDSLALGLPVGQAVGRLGCFLAGCDYGRLVEGGREALPWAVHFSDPHSLVPAELQFDADGHPLYLHPAQIYLLLGNLVVFGLLWMADRRAKATFPGRLVPLYFMLYAVNRGVLEHWRGDEDRGVFDLGFWQPSFSQLFSVIFFVAGVLLYRALRRRADVAPSPGPRARCSSLPSRGRSRRAAPSWHGRSGPPAAGDRGRGTCRWAGCRTRAPSGGTPYRPCRDARRPRAPRARRADVGRGGRSARPPCSARTRTCPVPAPSAPPSRSRRP